MYNYVFRQSAPFELDGVLSKKLNEIGQDLKSLINTDKVFDEDEKIFYNQDIAILLKVSYRTLQRYRTSGKLPYFSIDHKTYYRTNDVRNFVREHMGSRHIKRLKKANLSINDSAFKFKQNRANDGGLF